MSAELVLTRNGAESRAAFIADGVLTDYRVASAARPSFAGGVYTGKLRKRLKSLNAAIVAVPGCEVWVDFGRSSLKPNEGSTVLIQVLQDAFDGKLPRGTLEPAVAGRYLAYMPLTREPALSHRLTDDRTRSWLGNKLKLLKNAGIGSFLGLWRAAGATEAGIAREAAQLRSLWDWAQTRSAAADVPAVLIPPPDAPFDLLRTSVDERLTRIAADSETLANEVRSWLVEWAPEWRGKVERAPASQRPLEAPEIADQLAAALEREVALPSGAAVVFESAAGMTVVDVDSDRMTLDGSAPLSFARLNAEAARSIAQQIRLRNLGGRIVVDFAGIHETRNLGDAMNALREGVAGDPMSVRIARPSELGLVELIRRRERPTLAAMLAAPA